MTAAEIEKLEAGRELDAAVAEHVMGWRHDYRLSQTHALPWRIVREGDDYPSEIIASSNWAPSTDIAAAWKVVQKMSEQEDWNGFLYAMQSLAGPHGHDGCDLLEWLFFLVDAPLVICIAALKATLVKGAP